MHLINSHQAVGTDTYEYSKYKTKLIEGLRQQKVFLANDKVVTFLTNDFGDDIVTSESSVGFCCLKIKPYEYKGLERANGRFKSVEKDKSSSESVKSDKRKYTSVLGQKLAEAKRELENADYLHPSLRSHSSENTEQQNVDKKEISYLKPSKLIKNPSTPKIDK